MRTGPTKGSASRRAIMSELPHSREPAPGPTGAPPRQAHFPLQARLPRQARRPLAILAAALLLTLTLALPVIAMTPMTPRDDPAVKRIHTAVDQMSKLVKDRLRAPSARLSQSLPADADRVDRLREPAATAQEQLSIVLGELQQMKALTLNPHYGPAVIAAGRAFMAVSGQDPLTRTAINPEYQGLANEVAADASRLRRSAGDATDVSGAVRALSKQLAQTRRHVRRLETRAR